MIHIFKDKLTSLKDKVISPKKRPRGFVQVFENNNNELKKITESNNLVVYAGRNWLMKRAFNQLTTTQASPGINSYISWFGLGVGGSTSNLLTPVTPILTDDDLYNQIVINANDPACAYDGRLHPFDNVVFEEDDDNQSELLIANVTTTIGENDANGPSGSVGESAYYDLNEAALYISNTHVSNSFDPSSLKLFARVTFSTTRKTSNRQLVIMWKIYF